MTNQIIFFGNGPLADVALSVLKHHFEIVFHARTKEDLAKVKEIKEKNPEIHGILASFGVLIKKDLLELFEPEGIINIHPSLLPKFRGASPIESAILAGDTDFSVSIMKLTAGMDAGPVFYQTTISGLPLEKSAIYTALAEAGANWLVKNLTNLPTPTPQNEQNATFCGKFDKSNSLLDPENKSAKQLLREIIAFSGYPKSKYALFGHECIILAAHIANPSETPLIGIKCQDAQILALDRIQPAGRKPMDAKSFLNGYAKN